MLKESPGGHAPPPRPGPERSPGGRAPRPLSRAGAKRASDPAPRQARPDWRAGSGGRKGAPALCPAPGRPPPARLRRAMHEFALLSFPKEEDEVATERGAGRNPECLMRFVKSPPHNAAHRHRLLPPPTAHCRPSVGRPGQPRAAWAQAGLPVLGGRGLGPTEEELAEQTPAHPVFPGVTGTSCLVAALSRRELWLCPGGHCPLG